MLSIALHRVIGAMTTLQNTERQEKVKNDRVKVKQHDNEGLVVPLPILQS